MLSIAGHLFFLQVKEVNASVLEAYAGESAYPHHGQRVVIGQRLMQPASDLFLGWAMGPKWKHFYLRQLFDVKLRARRETNESSASEERRNRIANALGATRARKAILGG